MSDVTFNMSDNSVEVHRKRSEPWRVTLVETGEETMTGGRLKKVAGYLEDEEQFCFTYGDGVGDVDITESINFHRQHGKLATLTTTSPPGQFGVIDLDKNQVLRFAEKPKDSGRQGDSQAVDSQRAAILNDGPMMS